MEIEWTAGQIWRYLQKEVNDTDKVKLTIDYLESCKDLIEEEWNVEGRKKYLLKKALESNSKQFKLIARTQAGNVDEIFQWCDEEFNFLNMCSNQESETNYSFEELESVIDRALSYLKYVRDKKQFFSTNLHILGL